MKQNKKYRVKVRKRNKNKNESNRTTEMSLTENVGFSNTTTNEFRKRRRKKRRRRKKQNQDNILEITTARSINNTLTYVHINNTLKYLNSTHGNHDIYAQNGTEKMNVNNSSTPRKQSRCKIKNGGCSQICRPKGKTKCSCLKGYRLAKNRKKCIDIDECRIKNGGCKEICRNSLGGYVCDCSLGFRLSEDYKSCQDINECHLRNGHGPCQDTCTNTYGSYICDCSHLNGTRLATDKHSCDDINECEEFNPGCSHLCINTRVGAFCSCPEGMELMSDYKTCQDVDECEDASIKSLCSRGCVNTIGSYYCEEDFQNDHYVNKKKIPSCPPLDLPQHGFITCYRNNSLPYDTFTKYGRKIIKNSPGTKCHLECPVGFRLLGEGRYICDISGKWVIRKKGLCIKSPYPKLHCPPDQTFFLNKGQRSILVRFPAPQTNIRWKIVKSYPKWAKNLKGKLSEGRHNIQFSVTDPASKLSSTCSFSVLVKK
ncbi:hypothetical protein Zmor_005634 [Zophobas morio]|uniref:Sushi domain-containing protein n=1 Tax=Zophobas morio TaxID=2755281 RepID=A0AA38INQ2_9CUCU|nr:hypothetical protein Zmor_005634 [Zophobas morio]